MAIKYGLRRNMMIGGCFLRRRSSMNRLQKIIFDGFFAYKANLSLYLFSPTKPDKLLYSRKEMMLDLLFEKKSIYCYMRNMIIELFSEQKIVDEEAALYDLLLRKHFIIVFLLSYNAI